MRRATHVFTKQMSLRSAVLTVATLFAALLVPVAVLAWGPSRPTFTMENPATYVTFDSITDNSNFGDERNFFRVREVDSSSAMSFQDDATLTAGKEYEAVVFFHNNASSNLNDSGVGIAHGAYARAEMPAIVKAGDQAANAEAFVGASNANPTQVYDYIKLKNPSTTDMALRLVPGSVKYQSYGPHDGDTLSDTALFSGSGQPLGYDSLDGTLPGCDRYSGYITYRFTAMQPNFTFAKDVRQSGTKIWQDKVTVPQGSTVEYRLSYDNTGNTEQDDVTLKDTLPAGLTYVQGSTKLYASDSPEGKTLSDEISQGGMNIGGFKPGANAYLTFSARVDGVPCSTQTNQGYAVTNNGNLEDDATVVVAAGGGCSLPTTGPVQVIAGLIGVAGITFGVVYYFMSRRDLETTLHEVQMHPTTITMSSDEPEHKQPEHRHEHK